MIKKTGKSHQHEVLHNLIANDVPWFDPDLDDLLTKNRKQFEEDWHFAMLKTPTIEEFHKYLESLTSLEKFFLGVRVTPSE